MAIVTKIEISLIDHYMRMQFHDNGHFKNCDSIVLYPRWLPFVEKLFLIDKSQL